MMMDTSTRTTTNLNVENVLPFLDWSADLLRRYLGVFRTSDLDMESILRFVIAFLVFEMVLYRVLYSVLFSKQTSNDTNNNNNDDDKKHKELKLYGGCYIISQFVSLFACTRGTVMFYALLDMPPDVQYNGVLPPNADPAEGELATRLMSHLAYTNEMFVSYLLSDVITLLRYYGDYGKLDMIIHHVGFIVCSAVCHYFFILPITFTFLIQGEWSTLFLNLRWFLKQMDKPTTMADVSFALTFFLVRVVLYGYGLIHLLRGIYMSDDLDPHPIMPNWVRSFVVVLVVGFFFLNLFWFYKIVRIGRGKVKEGRKKKRTEEEQEGSGIINGNKKEN